MDQEQPVGQSEAKSEKQARKSETSKHARMLSEYEQARLERVERNKRKLDELGLGKPPSQGTKKKHKTKANKVEPVPVARRTSARERKNVVHQSFAGLDVRGKKEPDAPFVYQVDEDDDDDTVSDDQE
eukprot:115998-Prymnesium_polylepis.1